MHSQGFESDVDLCLLLLHLQLIVMRGRKLDTIARRRWIAVLACVLLVGAVSSAAGAVARLGAQDGTYAAWAPGKAAPVAAIDALSPATRPSAVDEAVGRMAKATGGDPSTAVETIRVVRADIGTDHSTLYAFKPDGTATCLLLWKRSSICPTTVDSSSPGVLWMISGGYPAWARTDGVAIPDAIIGLVADKVKDVTLVQGKTERPLDLSTNAFFAELDSREPDDALRVTYTDGTGSTISIG